MTVPTAQHAPRASAPLVEIRPLRTAAELQQCVELQRATWGSDFDDIVPPSVLTVAQKIGGIAAGAFEADGRMVGFVFGLAGVRDGQVIHWSDMLAVREDARDRGIGKQLKEYQRATARASGATTMYWTFDPLVARNAHLNFNQLGVAVDEYVEDMYGASASDLHRGLGTDRFIVAWPLDRDPRPGAETVMSPGYEDVPVINPGARQLTPVLLRTFDASAPASLRVEIPLDIVGVRDARPEDAARWRASTRAAFQWALGRGFGVERFVADRASSRGWYLMARHDAGARR